MYQICIIFIEHWSLIRFFSIYIAVMHLLPSVFNREFLTSYALKAINFSKTLEISIAFMYDYFIWRRTEEAITGLTRNQFTGIIPVRGFESLRLRSFQSKYFSMRSIIFIQTFLFRYFYLERKP